jgi:hypothetical protein
MKKTEENLYNKTDMLYFASNLMKELLAVKFENSEFATISTSNLKQIDTIISKYTKIIK